MATHSSSSDQIDPINYNEAKKHSHWHTTMSEEFEALVQNSTWTLVPTSAKQNFVDYIWIFRTK